MGNITDHTTLAVLANPTDRQLAMLEQLPPDTGLAVGDNPEAFKRVAADAEAILNWSGSGKLLREVFGMCPNVRWVHSRAAGLDGLLFPELVESSVILTNGSGVFGESLGEFAMAGILFFAKRLRPMLNNQAAGRWAPMTVTEIAGQTAGIVGYGDIGRAVARRARAMDMRVLAVKRHASGEEGIYPPDRRAEMIAQSDYVVVAAPLTEETRGMIGEVEFAAMKPSAVVINLGRGPVIDEAALIRALRGGRIQGAVLDVFDREPLPAGHPFYSMENVLLSPHCADNTDRWLDNAMQRFLDNFARFHEGKPLLSVVNKKLGY